MGKRGEAYRKRRQARERALQSEFRGQVMKVLFSPLLRGACEWIDANPGENPELEKHVKAILRGLKRLNREWQAAQRDYRKRRKRLRIVK